MAKYSDIFKCVGAEESLKALGDILEDLIEISNLSDEECRRSEENFRRLEADKIREQIFKW